MLLDNETLFCENLEITSGTSYSTNTIKFGDGDISFVPVTVQVVEEFLGLVDLTIKFQTSLDKDFTNPVDLISATLPLADLKEGNTFPFCHLPKGNLGYIRLCFIANGTATKGKITAGCTYGNDSGR